MRDIRDVIESGGPHVGEDIRRLALRATSRISDPARQASLYDNLILVLHSFELERICGSPPTFAADTARLLLDEIAAASLPN